MSTEEIKEIDTEMEESTEVDAVVEVDATSVQLLTEISNDVHIMLVFVIVTFVTSCFRSWRKTVIKGVR